MLTKFVDGMPLKRWTIMRLKRSGYVPVTSDSTGEEAVKRSITGARLLSERNAFVQGARNAQEGIDKLTTAQGALALGKSLVQQARELASTANNSGVVRAALTAEVNDLLNQAKLALDGTMYSGSKLFDGEGSEIRVQTGVSTGSSFGVKLAGSQTVTQTTSGTKEWTRLMGSSDKDNLTGLAAGGNGSIYATGSTRGNLDGFTNANPTGVPNDPVWEPKEDIFLMRYNSDGTVAWASQFGSSGSDRSNAVGVSGDGSIYIAGRTDGNLDGNFQTGNGDVFIAKFNSDGTKAWTQTLGTGSIEEGKDLAVGPDGSVYVVGYTSGSFPGLTHDRADAFLVKYNSDGTRAWTRTLGGAGDEVANGIGVSSDGSIVIAGTTSLDLDGNTSMGGSDAFIAKFNSNGDKVWTRMIGSNEIDSGSSVDVGSDGSIYLSGTTLGSIDGQTNNGGNDGFIAKFSSTGTKLWTKLYGTSSDDSFADVALSDDGSLYVNGTTYGFFGGTKSGLTDAVLAKVSADGVMQWSSQTGSADTDYFEEEGGTSIVVSGGAVYGGGNVGDPIEGQTYRGFGDGFIQKFAPDITTQTTSTAVSTYQGLTVDLSTASSTTTALANIDSALAYFTTTARSVSSGLIRANRAMSYLTNAEGLLNTALAQVQTQPAFPDDIESLYSSIDEKMRSMGDSKQVNRRALNKFLSKYIREMLS
jgi:uncharacterized delta-60 repeat protein